MIRRISSLLTVLALFCLAIAGIVLAIAHDPDKLLYNLQAETLANFSFALLALAFILRLFCYIALPKRKDSR